MESQNDVELISQLLPEISTYIRYAMGNIHFAAAAHAPFPAQTTVGTPRRDTPVHQRRAAEMNVSAINIDRKERKIKEIRVFFDDGTYESFVPSSK